MRSFTKKNVPYNESIYHLLYTGKDDSDLGKLRKFLNDDLKEAGKNLITLFKTETLTDSEKAPFEGITGFPEELTTEQYKVGNKELVKFNLPADPVDQDNPTPDEIKEQKASVLWNLNQLKPTPAEIEDKLQNKAGVSAAYAKKLGPFLALRELLRFAKIRARYENLTSFRLKEPDPDKEDRIYINGVAMKNTNEELWSNRPDFGIDDHDELTNIENGTFIPFSEILSNSSDYISNFQKKEADFSPSELNGSKIIKLYEVLSNKNAANGYRKAKLSLVNSHGLYCAFCETPLNDGNNGDIEHKLPKSIFPTDSQNWENFVLACATCNQTHKGTKHAIPLNVETRVINGRKFYFKIEGFIIPIRRGKVNNEGQDVYKTQVFAIGNENESQAVDFTNRYNYDSHPFSKTTSAYFAILAVLNHGYSTNSYNLSKLLEWGMKVAWLYHSHNDVNSQDTYQQSFTKKYNLIPENGNKTGDAEAIGPANFKEFRRILAKTLLISACSASGYKNLISDAKFDNLGDEIEKFITVKTKAGKKKEKDKDGKAQTVNIIIYDGINLEPIKIAQKICSLLPIENKENVYSRFRNGAISGCAWPDLLTEKKGGFKNYYYRSQSTLTFDEIAKGELVCSVNNDYVHQAHLKTQQDLNHYRPGRTVISELIGGTENVDLNRKALNLNDICGLNIGSKNSPWIDQRVVRRTKAWYHAIKQLNYLKSYKTQYKTLNEYYEEQLDPKEFGGKSEIQRFKADPGNSESGKWKNNRDELSKKLTDANGFLRDSIWKNISSMVKDGGFYSTWVRTFQNYCDPKDPIERKNRNANHVIAERHDLELVRRLEIDSQSNPGDPFQFHGTDAKEILDVLSND